MQDKEFAAILQDEPQQPLALVPLTEEEQVSLHFSAFTDASCNCHKNLISLDNMNNIVRCKYISHLFDWVSFTFQRNFSMSVNSVAVLRLMGKGGGAVPTGVARGRGSTRGGRGGLWPLVRVWNRTIWLAEVASASKNFENGHCFSKCRNYMISLLNNFCMDMSVKLIRFFLCVCVSVCVTTV